MSNLSELLNLIEYSDKTCIIISDTNIVYMSEKKGVSPMLDYYSQFGKSEIPLIIVDRIMGKGAVILADLIGATTIVTPTISEIALEYARMKNMEVTYDKTVPYVINRTRDGQCPIESSVIDINDTAEGYDIICDTLKILNNS